MKNWSDCGADPMSDIRVTSNRELAKLNHRAREAINELANCTSRGDGQWHTQEDRVINHLRVTSPHGYVYDLTNDIRYEMHPTVKKLLGDLLNERIAVQKGRVG